MYCLLKQCFFLDLDDCAPNPCYPGVECLDAPAPSRGYRCGPCPPPTTGDGTTCTQPRSVPCPSTVRCYPGVPCQQVGKENIVCGSCPPGFEGDGTLCRQRCFPPCNAHQKCSQQVCNSTSDYSASQTTSLGNGAPKTRSLANLAPRATALATLTGTQSIQNPPSSQLCRKPCR